MHSSACIPLGKSMAPCQIPSKNVKKILLRLEAAASFFSWQNDYWHHVLNNHSHFPESLNPYCNSEIWRGCPNFSNWTWCDWYSKPEIIDIHTAEIIKHWFVIVVVSGFGCIERDWNLYSWGGSQTAGTDSAKAPIDLVCLGRVPQFFSPTPATKSKMHVEKKIRSY